MSIGVFVWRLYLPIAILFKNDLPRSLHRPIAIVVGIPSLLVTSLAFDFWSVSAVIAHQDVPIYLAGMPSFTLRRFSRNKYRMRASTARYVRYRTDCG